MTSFVCFETFDDFSLGMTSTHPERADDKSEKEEVLEDGSVAITLGEAQEGDQVAIQDAFEKE